MRQACKGGWLRNLNEGQKGVEAMIVLGHRPVELHIVLTDIEMPGSMDGFALASWIRQNRPELEVILAGTLSRAVDAAVKLCESGPIPGRYERQNLLAAIRRLMATRAARRVKAGWRGLTSRMRISTSRRW